MRLTSVVHPHRIFPSLGSCLHHNALRQPRGKLFSASASYTALTALIIHEFYWPRGSAFPEASPLTSHHICTILLVLWLSGRGKRSGLRRTFSRATIVALAYSLAGRAAIRQRAASLPYSTRMSGNPSLTHAFMMDDVQGRGLGVVGRRPR